MPIEFYCPGCGNLMRTPDETAGRKGRCPTCQLKVQIPGESVASSASDSIAKPISTAPKQPQAKPIQFDCQSCGRSLSVAGANAGKKGQCPHCGGQMSIPLASQTKPSTPNDGLRESRWKGAPETNKPSAQPQLTKAGGEKIEFHCSNCKEVVRVGAAAAGKRGQCPRCKAVIEIPMKSTSVAGLDPIPSPQPKPAAPKPKPLASDPTPGLTPLPSAPSQQTPVAPTSQATPGLTPLPAEPEKTSGLTPLPSSQTPAAATPTTTPGLTPLPSEPSTPSGLTPLGPSPLTPLEPLGLTPLEPLAGGNNADPLGIGSPNQQNPFDAIPNQMPAPMMTPTHPTRAPSGSKSGAEIATTICGALLLCYAACQLVLLILALFINGIGGLTALDRIRDQGGDMATATGYMVGQVIGVGLGCALQLTILAGGVQMIRFKTWGLCLTACILTIVPCNCFCLAGLPIGIWGVIMLSLESVRKSFK